MTDLYFPPLYSQSHEIIAWLEQLDDDDFARPSTLPGWDVRTLVAHLVLVVDGVSRGLSAPVAEAPLAIWEYVRRYSPASEDINNRTVEVAADRTPRELIDLLTAARENMPVTLPAAAAVMGGRGPIRPADWVVTRIVELVVHSDDLSRSLPDRAPIPIAEHAMRTTVRALADVLAKSAPGRSVEVRVPPFVAVQAIEGPRHTRGTPPNVVEADPLTWVRVAAGRTSFTDAVASGAIHASGQRADLTPFLPLL